MGVMAAAVLSPAAQAWPSWCRPNCFQTVAAIYSQQSLTGLYTAL